MYPPHLIAFAALYMVCIIDPGTRRSHVEWTEQQTSAAVHAQAQSGPATRRSSRHASSSSNPTAGGSTPASNSSGHTDMTQDLVGFWANLNISMPAVAAIVQDMITFYALCSRLKDDAGSTSQSDTIATPRAARSRLKRSHVEASDSHNPSYVLNATESFTDQMEQGSVVTPAFLLHLLIEMRAKRESDMTHPASGRPVAVHKVLERAQAAG